MEISIIILIIIVVFGIIGAKTNRRTTFSKPKTGEYAYTKKERIITQYELAFYQTLHEVVSGCIIIPQAHLSIFLNHKVRGQNWSRAFSRINGKSVDFLICTNDMRPLLAIELDDITHNRPDRQQRDAFVNTVITSAHIPLLRFTASGWNTDTIKQQVAQALHASVFEK
ncbi:DUF2726 domain-containing protein [Candidatus Saccharibacteria bacterium oral taxon 488]|jgi:DNA topoisomerase type IA zn finger domain protein|nr:DUF2726 domain-containing protein [Candidatus Saccharibacteria bacterium oral taxon 488]